MKLRDYQVDCEAAIRAEHERVDSTLAVLPTGCGKTEVFVSYGGKVDAGRVLTICPTIELVDQGANKFTARTGIKPDIEQAHRTSPESSLYRSPYVCASKQTLVAKRNGKARYERLNEIALVIIDEAHGAGTKQWGDLIGHFRDQGAKILGVTATPKRADDVALGNLFDSCAYEMWIPDAIDRGWLVSPLAVCCQLESLDLSQVGTKGKRGDFKDGELAKVMGDEKVVFETAEVTARESVVEGKVLKTVVYCATVAEARGVAERLRDKHGVRADWVCGDKRLCPSDRRRRVLEDFAAPDGSTTHVCNVGVLTTGWDFPGLEHIVMGRPTRSVGLYTQILGRGTRPLPGVVDFEGSDPTSRRAAIAASDKPHFKVTDLCDNTLEHSLVGVADVLAGLSQLADPSQKKSVDDAVAAEVAEQTRRGDPVDVQAAIAAAREAEKKRREEEEEKRRQRRLVASEAKYSRVEVEALGQGGAGSARGRQGIGYRMPFGKHKGKSIGELNGNYISSLLKFSSDPSTTFKLGQKVKYLLESELSARKAGVASAPPKPARRKAAPTAPKASSPTDTYASLSSELERQLSLLDH